MDILQPIPLEQWFFLRDEFKRDWPTYAQETLFTVVLSGFKDSMDLLRKSLIETNVIDWNQKVLFSAVHQHFIDTLMESIKEVQRKKQIKMDIDVTNYHFKPKEECLKISVNVPKECELNQLDKTHIPLIHSLWPHRSQENPDFSMKYLQSFVMYNRGLGLFLKKDNSLVSWILQTDWNGLGMLQTIEEHRRKGYGKIVVEAMIKELAEEEDLDSITFIIEGNTPSEKLFASLGYTKLTTATWILVTPI